MNSKIALTKGSVSSKEDLSTKRVEAKFLPQMLTEPELLKNQIQTMNMFSEIVSRNH